MKKHSSLSRTTILFRGPAFFYQSNRVWKKSPAERHKEINPLNKYIMSSKNSVELAKIRLDYMEVWRGWGVALSRDFSARQYVRSVRANDDFPFADKMAEFWAEKASADYAIAKVRLERQEVIVRNEGYTICTGCGCPDWHAENVLKIPCCPDALFI